MATAAAPRTTAHAAAVRTAAVLPSVKAVAATAAVTKTDVPAPVHSAMPPPVHTARPLVKSTHTPIAITPAPTAAPTPTPLAVVAADMGDAAHGKQLFAQNCATCHTITGRSSIGPTLQAESSRKNLEQTIAWIKKPQPPMPSLYPGNLSAKDVLDIATYVQTLK